MSNLVQNRYLVERRNQHVRASSMSFLFELFGLKICFNYAPYYAFIIAKSLGTLKYEKKEYDS